VCRVVLVELWRRGVGESWWKIVDDLWGRVAGTVKTVCGYSWWNCEENVWGRDGGIVK